LLLQQLQQQGVPLSAVRICSSPFSRTVETASIAAAAAGLDPAAIQVGTSPHSAMQLLCVFGICWCSKLAWHEDVQLMQKIRTA
jgi:phosphohistidine phosphatase SixA